MEYFPLSSPSENLLGNRQCLPCRPQWLDRHRQVSDISKDGKLQGKWLWGTLRPGQGWWGRGFGLRERATGKWKRFVPEEELRKNSGASLRRAALEITLSHLFLPFNLWPCIVFYFPWEWGHREPARGACSQPPPHRELWASQGTLERQRETSNILHF